MNSVDPVVISDNNLSRVWAKILVHAVDHPGTEISPLIASVTGFDGPDLIPELPSVREALDALLSKQEEFAVSTVANTIFPQSVWRIAGGDRAVLYKEYIEAVPRYAAMERLNRDGTYFSRLVAFDLDARTGQRIPGLAGVPEDGNQLEFVIRTLKAGDIRRDSAFQASIFDPTRDHAPRLYRGFPCMQHMTFIRLEGGGLALNAFYATQQIVRKAYGNLLGLCRLGHFVAEGTGLAFERLNVFVGCEKIGGLAKSHADLAPVLEASRQAISEVVEAPKGKPTPKVRR